MGRYYGGDIEGKFWFGVQSSDDPEFFGVEGDYIHPDDNEEEEPWGLMYKFESDDLEAVEEGIDTCMQKLGDNLIKLDDFFRDNDGWNKDIIAKALDVEKSKVDYLMQWYARLELGRKIKWSIKANGRCYFDCQL